MNSIISAGDEVGLKLIPVINLNDDTKIKEAVRALSKKYSMGICLRISKSDLAEMEQLNEGLKHFLGVVELNENEIDLLIDIKEINEKNDNYLHFAKLSQRINNLKTWRSLIFASGAFPVDLTECKIDEPTLLPRFDWQSWLELITNHKLERTPTYSDYTVRNPIFNEAFQFFHPSTSIKYTIEHDWYILKGKKLEYAYYVINAKLLVEESGKFYGEDFSAGDKFTMVKAKHCDAYLKNPALKQTGGPEGWIAAGINHHLVLVVSQVSNLP